jgi:hypothetical protein
VQWSELSSCGPYLGLNQNRGKLLISLTELGPHPVDSGKRSFSMTSQTPSDERATWAGYLLLFLASATMIGCCLQFGAEWFSLAVESLPSEARNGVELPDERLLTLPKVQVLLGLLIYGVAILPGLAAFRAGEWLLNRIGVPVWVKTADEP